jgi:hypothetical protein
LPKAVTEIKWAQSGAPISKGLATLFKLLLGNCNNHPKVVATRRALSKSDNISSGRLKPTNHNKHNRKYIKI